MSSVSEFTVVKRPSESRSRNGAFQVALQATLASGEAVAIPIAAGDNFAITRNRISARGYEQAKKMGAALRTCKSDDGLSVLIWLEKK